METMGLNEDERSEVLHLVCAILHLGNVMFAEKQNEEAFVQVDDSEELFSMFKELN